MDIALYINIDSDQRNTNYRYELYLHFNFEQYNKLQILYLNYHNKQRIKRYKANVRDILLFSAY